MAVHNSAQQLQAKPPAPQEGERGRFTDLMRVSFDRPDPAGHGREQELRQAANQLVSVAFIKPMLAQMRQSPFQNEMFHGGQGETMFQEHLDTVLADRIATRASYSIADAIYRKIAKSAGLSDVSQPAAATGRVNRHG